ncbi:MAG: class I SAM-dependent rRNA methyltransferase [Candidatus Omnitrophica bacterium]|nr:class I SAM-dependent rRNA methyltransferase [Candidatus Omnitrophota bacterium]
MKTIQLILKPGKEKPIKGRHPWVFSGAIDRIDDSFETGDLVSVFSAQKEFLGTGYLNPRSQIAVRMLSFEEGPINEKFFEQRIEHALGLRSRFIPPDTNACRLIHSEGDFLPGLIVDRYADYLVVQFQTAGIDRWRETILSILEARAGCRGIFEKDDSEMRGWEGLEKRVGRLVGEEPPDYVEIKEYGIPFIVDIHAGQKTGFFLDQRENRKLVSSHANGKRVLNTFAYTGGFSVYAARSGASRVVSVETSERALNTCRANFELNGLIEKNEKGDPPRFEFVKEDVFEYLRKTTEEFDLIVLDPPAFAKSQDHVMQASRGYKDLNLWAMKRLSRGGLLYTSSCSSYVNPDLFQKIVFAAAKDARRDVQILAKTSHAPDHPINVFHPEGEYLKGLLCLVG